MSDQQGWVKIHRKLLENPICRNTAWFSVWVQLLLLAGHEDNSFIWDRQRFNLKAGQFITGRKKLSEQCCVSESTIERILNYLESEHQIGQQKTTKYRIISIVNWSKYQGERTAKRTTDGQQTDTIKNDNNDNKLKQFFKKEENTNAQRGEMLSKLEIGSRLRAIKSEIL